MHTLPQIQGAILGGGGPVGSEFQDSKRGAPIV